MLPKIIKSYNATYHRTIKRTPNQVKKSDEPYIWMDAYDSASKNVNHKPSLTKTIHFKFKIGDFVRISHIRKPFDREYDERWTGEQFNVKSRLIKQTIPIYELQDIDGEDVEGTFYEGELQKVTITDDTMYRIERVIRYKGNQVLVKWWGWPKKFNSFIPRSSLKYYKKS